MRAAGKLKALGNAKKMTREEAQAKADICVATGAAPPQTPTSPHEQQQTAPAKRPRVKPTLKLVRVRREQGAVKYWRIMFPHEGRPRCKWFGSEHALTQEQAQALPDAWLKEHHPEFFEGNE